MATHPCRTLETGWSLSATSGCRAEWHTTATIIRRSRQLQVRSRTSAALNHADVLIGHNIKFDLTWIRECGFVYKGDIYDTMVAEYILAKARRWPLGLAALAEKYDVTRKEKDLVEPYLKDGKTFYDIPWEIIEEYGRADVLATEEIALKQLDAFGVTFEEMFNEPRTDTETVTGDDQHAFTD